MSFVKDTVNSLKTVLCPFKGSQVRVEDKLWSTNIELEDFFYGYQLHYIAFCCTTAIAQVLWAIRTRNANEHKTLMGINNRSNSFLW